MKDDDQVFNLKSEKELTTEFKPCMQHSPLFSAQYYDDQCDHCDIRYLFLSQGDVRGGVVAAICFMFVLFFEKFSF